jgi:hypothetical protein
MVPCRPIWAYGRHLSNSPSRVDTGWVQRGLGYLPASPEFPSLDSNELDNKDRGIDSRRPWRVRLAVKGKERPSDTWETGCLVVLTS